MILIDNTHLLRLEVTEQRIDVGFDFDDFNVQIKTNKGGCFGKGVLVSGWNGGLDVRLLTITHETVILIDMDVNKPNNIIEIPRNMITSVEIRDYEFEKYFRHLVLADLKKLKMGLKEYSEREQFKQTASLMWKLFDLKEIRKTIKDVNESNVNFVADFTDDPKTNKAKKT